MSRAILLFAHGARDPSWALPFEAIQARVAASPQRPRVALAYLEMMQPSLGDAAAGLIADGVDELTVVPLFMAQGGHLKRDLPLLLDELRASHPGLRITLTPSIGEVPELTEAIAAWVCGLVPAVATDEDVRPRI